MGHYRCAECGTQRPVPEVHASGIRLHGADGASATITADEGTIPISTVLPGLYNVYDATAAAAGALAVGVAAETIGRGIMATAPAFGRGERVVIDGREALFLLAKNPAGFNEVLRTVLLAEEAPVLLIAINDLIADGRDISWLWDVDFEMLRDRARATVVTGIRALDLALRLKYAGVDAARVTVEPDGARALDRARQLLREGERLYILPTYTAMLHLRAALARKGYVRGFWKQ
jgi:UDP-N-acetylmuramyl tripeptide synthase